MTDNEIKAIETLKDLATTIYYGDMRFVESDDLKIILNLIEKQQEEIERLKCNNEILQGELDRIGVKTLKLDIGSSTDDIIMEIEKKDKMIDLMAKKIFYWQDDKFPLGYAIKDIKEYFERKCEE